MAEKKGILERLNEAFKRKPKPAEKPPEEKPKEEKPKRQRPKKK